MHFLQMLTNPQAFLTGFFCLVGAGLVYLGHSDAGVLLLTAAVGMGHRLVPEAAKS